MVLATPGQSETVGWVSPFVAQIQTCQARNQQQDERLVTQTCALDCQAHSGMAVCSALSWMLTTAPWCNYALTVRWMAPFANAIFKQQPHKLPSHHRQEHGGLTEPDFASLEQLLVNGCDDDGELVNVVSANDDEHDSDADSEEEDDDDDCIIVEDAMDAISWGKDGKDSLPIGDAGSGCASCSKSLAGSDVVECVEVYCSYKAHLECCAQQLLQTNQLVPVQGPCPHCGTTMVWGDVLRRCLLRRQGKILKRQPDALTALGAVEPEQSFARLGQLNQA
eukprot:TRINITY_DN12002_c1_g1_i5.p1 TRINITY_DN12002_c1_g1~~TRINITY_DN12002_c1_g1_i5.p1  ORF type:complete len:279 (+),score=42.07 TRINITY_DN12002_c1_g1_i5:847-1683(+)